MKTLKNEINKIKKLSDTKLRAEFKDYYFRVNVEECFSCSDVTIFDHLGYELERRGKDVEEIVEAIWQKFNETQENDEN